MNVMDQLASVKASPAMTEAESGEIEASVAKGAEATRAAEKAVRELPPGHQRWHCPDASCAFVAEGPIDGPAHMAWKGHCQRHHHARFPQTPRAG